MDKQTIRAYRTALNDMPAGSRPNVLAHIADRMAGDAFDRRDLGAFKPLSSDDMMGIEASIFVGLCKANGVDWRLLVEC